MHLLGTSSHWFLIGLLIPSGRAAVSRAECNTVAPSTFEIHCKETHYLFCHGQKYASFTTKGNQLRGLPGMEIVSLFVELARGEGVIILAGRLNFGFWRVMVEGGPPISQEAFW